MGLSKLDFTKFAHPLRLLLEGNFDTWSSMLAVIEDLTPEQLSYNHPNYEQRTIAQMITHAIDTQYSFYTQTLVLGRKYKELKLKLPKTKNEAIKMIVKTFKTTTNLWKNLKPKDFTKEIHTEWGQVLTGELALFQSITHTHYHVSEICFLRGIGGFPTKAMG